MIFGDSIRPASSTASTDWIDRACHGESWTVGELIPNHYESLLRVFAPAPGDSWWSAYRELFGVVASVGEQHTSSPDRAWFAVWQGQRPPDSPLARRTARSVWTWRVSHSRYAEILDEGGLFVRGRPRQMMPTR